MKIGTVDLNEEVLVVAEIGNNHEGDLQLAKRLIGLAAEAGAGAVKFQTIVPERLVSAAETERLAQLRRFAFSRDDHEQLAEVAEGHGVIFLSTPFSIDVVDWLDPLVPAYKVASGDNDFSPLLERIAATGKPIIVSTGMSDQVGVERSVEQLRGWWSAAGAAPGLALLHCVSSYPTTPENANLAAMNVLKRLADVIGYSDHTLGIDVAVASVAAGARIVEKHFTISKTHSSFRDHALSATPEELAELVARIRQIDSMLGSGVKRVAECEEQTARAARRSIVAARDLDTGHVVALSDLDWLRPGDGLSPRSTGELLGRTLIRPVSRGEQMTLEMVD